MTKHFPGGGPQKDGEDPHFAYGREQVYPGGRFELPPEALRGRLRRPAPRQMMPYYGMPVGTEYEEVGFGFNKSVITDLLRDARLRRHHLHRLGPGHRRRDLRPADARPSVGRRAPVAARAGGAMILDAGADQFGGEACPELWSSSSRRWVTEDRIDASVRRLLREKFALGLFENPLRRRRGRAERSSAATSSAPPARPPSAPPSPCCPTGARTARDPRRCRSSRGIKLYVEGIDPSSPRVRQVVDHPGRGGRRHPAAQGALRGARDARSRTSSTPVRSTSPTTTVDRTSTHRRARADHRRRLPRSPRDPRAARRRAAALVVELRRQRRALSTCSRASPTRRAGCRSTCRGRWRRSRHPVPTCRSTRQSRSSGSDTASASSRLPRAPRVATAVRGRVPGRSASPPVGWRLSTTTRGGPVGLSNIEIAQAARMLPITEVAAGLGIPEESLEPYGRYKAKVRSVFRRSLRIGRRAGRARHGGIAHACR